MEHDHLTNFLKFNFPDPGERPFIDAVHQHKNTEAFCIAIYDSVFDSETKQRHTESNIIASISFRFLKDQDYSGAFVYYLTALQDRTFNQVSTSPSFQRMICPIEGNGFGELLLRNTQFFTYAIRGCYALYLAVNRNSNVLNYYNKLGFHRHEGFINIPGVVLSEIQDCTMLESNHLGLYYVLSMPTEIECPQLNAQSMIRRHCELVPRPHERLTDTPTEGYMRFIADLFDKQVAEKLTFPEYTERTAYEETDQFFSSLFTNSGEALNQGTTVKKPYISSGKAWEKYHKLWSMENVIKFWDFKKHYKAMLKTNQYRCQEKLMPLEHLFMEYCSVGRVIKDNDCSKNKEFNIICQFCENKMTKDTITLNCLEQYSTQIIQAHLVGRDYHCLAFNSRNAMEAFGTARLRQKYVISPCDAMNERKYYTKIYKAIVKDYCIPVEDRQEICIGTNRMFLAFFRQYTAGNYYKEFFKRTIKASGKNLRLLNNNRFDFPSVITDLIEWANPKDFDFKQNQKAIFDAIVDEKQKEYFFKSKNH